MAGIEKIVSGGQTGADRAALDFAIAQGILHGGWCPRDRMAEDGPIDVCYQLQETPRFLNRVQSRCNPHVVTNTITMLVSISAAPDGRVQSSGSVVTKMIDFGITPPAPSAGGLSIKTGDEVKLRFQWLLIVAPFLCTIRL